MSEQSSPTSPTVLAFFDPESSSWRTSQGCLLSAVPESLEHLPAWGTTSDGVLYELQTPERLTAARDGSALLGTPTRDNAVRSERFRSRNPNMGELAALLPTPVVYDMGANHTVESWDSWTDEMKKRHGNGNGHGASLSIEAARLLPTPKAFQSRVLVRPLDEPQNLVNALARLLPTPTVQDGANNAGPSQWERNSKPLNVVAVELTMGLTGTLSNDGNGSSDDEHPTQPMIEDCDPSLSSG